MELRDALLSETVADAGYRELVSVGTDASVRDAIAVMQEQRVGCVVVVDEGVLRGIFTERDVLMRVLSQGASLDGPLADVMTPEPVVVRVDELIHQVLARMYERGLRHLPVMDAGRPVGTISIKRAVHLVGSSMPLAIYNLPPEPDQFPAAAEGG